MKRFGILLRLELKRALKALPLMLAEAVVLCLFLGTMLLLCQKLFFGESIFRKIPLGIAAESRDEMTELALRYLEGMESTSAACEFRYMTEEEGRRALDKGELAALMVLPDEMVSAILDSRNYPVKVYFPKNSGMSAYLIKEMTDAGAGMLSVAQAEIYAVYDMSVSYESLASLNEMQNEINLFNMQFALARERLIRTEILQIPGDLPVMTLYAASGITLFFLLWGIACSRFLKGDSGAFGGQLARCKITGWKWMLAKWAAAAAVLAAGAGGLLGVAALMPGNFRLDWGQLPLILPVLSCIAALLLFAYRAAPSRSSGMMLIFTIAIAGIFLSGGFIPAYFLPEGMGRLAGVLPFRAMFTNLGQLLGADMRADKIGRACLLLGAWSLLFYMGAVAVNHRKGAEDS